MTALATCSPAWLKQASSSPDLQQLLTPRGSQYWPHHPTPRQIQGLVAHRFLPTDEPSEVFYGGAAGGGKSDWLLMGALEYVDVPDYAALILRRSYTDLALPGAIMARAKQWLGLKFWNEQRKQFTFPSGASLTFAYLRRNDDVFRYQSAEFQFVAFDELTQFTEDQYTYLFSRCRRPDEEETLRQILALQAQGQERSEAYRLLVGQLERARVPLRVRAASNPGGIGHGWVKKRFPIKPGETKGRRVFIPAKIDDNPHLDRKAYVKTLKHLPEVTQQQLLEGDWGVFEGAAYPEFSRAIHVVPAIELPDSWDRWEAMDHGVTNPTSWALFAADYDGNVIVADLYYKPGLPEEHAPAIKDRRLQWWQAKQDGWPVTHPAYGDPASLRESLPIQNDFGQPLSLQEHYQNLGIRLIPANNRRKIGFIEIRSRLKPDPTRRFPLWHPLAGQYNAPRLFFVETCVEMIDQVENAPLASEEADPERGEAVDRRWEGPDGHAHANLRYGLTQRSSASEEPEQEPEDPRTALLKRRAEARRKPRDKQVYDEL